MFTGRIKAAINREINAGVTRLQRQGRRGRGGDDEHECGAVLSVRERDRGWGPAVCDSAGWFFGGKRFAERGKKLGCDWAVGLDELG